MNYRSPVASLERELAELEEKLAALQAEPEHEPTPTREVRALKKKLAKIEGQIEKRMAATGRRNLTPKEQSAGVRMYRVGLAFVGISVAVLCVHVGLAVRHHLRWRETTCAIVWHNDGHEASWQEGGRTYTFDAVGSGESPPSRMPCFVSSPPVDGIGRLVPPHGDVVSLYDKLSFGWLMTAGLTFAMGIICLLANAHDRQRRESGQIDPDDFGSDD